MPIDFKSLLPNTEDPQAGMADTVPFRIRKPSLADAIVPVESAVPSQNMGLSYLDMQALASQTPAKSPVTASPPGGSGSGTETQIGKDGQPVKDYGSADRPDVRYGDAPAPTTGTPGQTGTLPAPTGGDATGTPQTGTPAGGSDFQTATTELKAQFPELWAADPKPYGARPAELRSPFDSPDKGLGAMLIPQIIGALSGNPYMASSIYEGIAGAVKGRHAEVVDYNKEINRLQIERSKENSAERRNLITQRIKDLEGQRMERVRMHETDVRETIANNRQSFEEFKWANPSAYQQGMLVIRNIEAAAAQERAAAYSGNAAETVRWHNIRAQQEYQLIGIRRQAVNNVHDRIVSGKANRDESVSALNGVVRVIDSLHNQILATDDPTEITRLNGEIDYYEGLKRSIEGAIQTRFPQTSPESTGGTPGAPGAPGATPGSPARTPTSLGMDPKQYAGKIVTVDGVKYRVANGLWTQVK